MTDRHPQHGERVFVRTVTYHYVGTVHDATLEWLTLTGVSLIFDSGEFASFIATGRGGQGVEQSAYPPETVVALNQAAIIEVAPITW